MTTVVITGLRSPTTRKAEVLRFVNTWKQAMYFFVFDLYFERKDT
jgi:hypothetical protein